MATQVATQATTFATQVETANQQLIDAARRCSAEDWQRQSASEGWSVGVLAHHVAQSYKPITDMVQAVAEGREPTVPTPDGQAKNNARHAEEYARVGQQETLDLLQRQGAAAATAVRGLSDAQLALTTKAFGGQEMTVAQLIENAVIGHSKQHLASIQSALKA